MLVYVYKLQHRNIIVKQMTFTVVFTNLLNNVCADNNFIMLKADSLPWVINSDSLSHPDE